MPLKSKNVTFTADPASQFLSTSEAKLVYQPTLFNPKASILRYESKRTLEKNPLRDSSIKAGPNRIPKPETTTTIGRRVKHAIEKGRPAREAFICGTVGAGAEKLTEGMGGAMLFTAASKLTIETGGVGLPAAALLFVGGHHQLEKINPVVGDFAQKTCHKTFDVIKKFEDQLMDSFNNSSSVSFTSPSKP